MLRLLKTFTIAALLNSTCFASLAYAKESEDSRCLQLNETLEKEYGYCGAVEAGGLLYVSGTVGSGDIKAGMVQAYENLKIILNKRGLDFSDVVRETVFTTDLDTFTENRGLRKSYYKGTYPAASWLQVEKLYGGKYSVEIEVTAKLR
ncbi:RidA family protein [Microbulbifer guangxiensis]|uniref:RidA family protein n=1 Tax=Microbulbifer guangxiensis TaxID=2904249 RepID=UPI001F2EF386|nr:RidA family protein [Microbulbifer guangxiensis]